jgi:hypothetical protein
MRRGCGGGVHCSLTVRPPDTADDAQKPDDDAGKTR